MKKRNLLYIAITIICIIAIIVGVYYQIFLSNPSDENIDNNQINNNTNDGNNEVDLEKVKEEFNSLFNNTFDSQGYDTSSIEKYIGLEEKDVVYTTQTVVEENEKYSLNINLPVFNVKSEVGEEFNVTTQSIFANKAGDIINNSTIYTIYNIEYAAYLNENILSLVIKATLKEGNHPQRVIVQTYNYNIETKQKVTLNEILEARGIDKEEVNQKIEKQVTEASRQAEAISEALAQTGQTIYKRDINNAMYVTDNVSHFFVGSEGQIYIVYPYGNSNYTSEIDIIKI